ncbi:MAG: hypothetical protein WBH56_05855, partial [Bacteroidota bacterium]
MSFPITAFLPYSGSGHTRALVERLTASGLVKRIYLLSTGKSGGTIRGCTPLPVDSLHGSQTVRRIAAKAGTPYALFVLHDNELEFGQFGLERMLDVARGTGAGIIYS